MKLSINEDEQYVSKVREALRKTGGYCPCVVLPQQDNLCMCKDFIDKINDPNFTGWCHCKLYYKEK